jgi:hypothetical protein
MTTQFCPKESNNVFAFSHSVCDCDMDISWCMTILPLEYHVMRPLLGFVPLLDFKAYHMSTVRRLKCILRIQCLHTPESYKKFVYFGLRDSRATFLSHDFHFDVDYCWWLGAGCDQRTDRHRISCQILYQEATTAERNHSGGGCVTIVRPD